MKIKDIDILKYIILNEEENKKSTFEEDPMGFILKKYASLNSLLEELMTPSFKEYLDGIYVMAPKPTTFRVVLHNKRYFFLTYLKNAYEASIGGKRYYLLEIGEKERCMLAISKLLQYGSPLVTQGPEGAEEGTRSEEESEKGTTGAEETSSEEETTSPGEKPLTERLILEYLIKEISMENIIDKILNDPISNGKLAKHSKSFKIKNIGNITPDDFKDILSKSLEIDINNIKVINPGAAGSRSRKFYTFDFDYNNKNYKIALASKSRGEDIEKIQIEYINNFIENFGQNIDILIEDQDILKEEEEEEKKSNSRVFENVYGVKKIPGNKPADFEFLTTGTSDTTNNLFIQHKDFKKSQQYCGFSKIKSHPEVKSFIEDIQHITKEFKPKEKYSRAISDPVLKHQTVYGIGDTYGENRIQAIYFGNLRLEKTNNPNDKEFKLVSDKYFTDITIPSGEYDPYLFATYRLDHNQEEIKYCRFNVCPQKFLKALDPPPKNLDPDSTTTTTTTDDNMTNTDNENPINKI
jgi:hypothetical protein